MNKETNRKFQHKYKRRIYQENCENKISKYKYEKIFGTILNNID